MPPERNAAIVMYRAAAALPHADRERATTGLREQLNVMAAAAGAIPDWTTFSVEGPVEQVELHDSGWSEWAATVTVTGGAHDLSDRVIDALAPAVRRPGEATVEDTAPLVDR